MLTIKLKEFVRSARVEFNPPSSRLIDGFRFRGRSGKLKTFLKSWLIGQPISTVYSLNKVTCSQYKLSLNIYNAIWKVYDKSQKSSRKYKDLLSWLNRELNTSNPYERNIRKSCEHFNEAVGNKIVKMRTYAVTDAQSFPGEIKKSHKGRVYCRYFFTSQEQFQDATKAANAVQINILRKGIQTANTYLSQASAGACTTFAAAATHIITGGQPDWGQKKARVEFVAVPTKNRVAHCFVLVGRPGGQSLVRIGKQQRLHLPLYPGDGWGGGTCAVDPWMLALGHEGIYPKLKNFRKEWLNGYFGSHPPEVPPGLEQWWDSHASPRVVRKLQNKQIMVNDDTKDLIDNLTLLRLVELEEATSYISSEQELNRWLENQEQMRELVEQFRKKNIIIAEATMMRTLYSLSADHLKDLRRDLNQTISTYEDLRAWLKVLADRVGL